MADEKLTFDALLRAACCRSNDTQLMADADEAVAALRNAVEVKQRAEAELERFGEAVPAGTHKRAVWSALRRVLGEEE